VAIVSCNSFSREREQQTKIDSLANEIRKRDSAEKKQIEIIPLEQKAIDTAIPIETDDEAGIKNKIEKVEKEKPKKDAITVEKNNEAVSENKMENEEAKDIGTASEMNAVLKKVIIEKPAFKPLMFGGFKDIKFNFFNNYQYKLEEAILKVHYIRSDGSEIKSETKILKDISPNSKLSLTAPDYTQAGREITVTLETVQCRAIDLCFYSSDPVKSDDPFRCR